jgi:methionyl aminopeptidase
MKQIIKKTPEQIANIRTAGKHLTELLLLTYENAKPGITGVELEQHAQRYLDMYNLTGAFKGYHGFPANLCVSINDGIVHGIPDQTQLTAGDLVKIDAGVVYQ